MMRVTQEMRGIDKLNLASLFIVFAMETPSTTIPTFFALFFCFLNPPLEKKIYRLLVMWLYRGLICINCWQNAIEFTLISPTNQDQET